MEFYVHGSVMAFALLVVFPIGLVMSIFKPIKNWYKYHKLAMLTTASLIFLGVIYGLYHTVILPASTNDISVYHSGVGIALLILILLQLWWAIVMRRYLKGNKWWLITHRIFATLITIFIILQIYLGTKALKSL